MIRKLVRTLKLSISLCYWCCSGLKRLMLRVIGQFPRGYCIVLYYHTVPATHRERFARQMDVALHWSSAIDAGRTEPLERGKSYFAVTFDDSFQSVLENALPELQRRQIPSTIFAVTQSLGQLPNWIKEESQGVTGRLMSAGDLKGSISNLVGIGSHTRTHPNLCNTAEAEARLEIVESRADLEALLCKPVRLFSFPYGAFNDTLVHCCKEAEYTRVFTTLPVPTLSDADQFVCGRVGAEPTDSSLEFFLKLQGAYAWLPKAFLLKKKLKRTFRIPIREYLQGKSQSQARSYQGDKS